MLYIANISLRNKSKIDISSREVLNQTQLMQNANGKILVLKKYKIDACIYKEKFKSPERVTMWINIRDFYIYM